MNSVESLKQNKQAEVKSERREKIDPLCMKREVSEIETERKLMRAPRSRKYIKAIKLAKDMPASTEEIKEQIECIPVRNKLIGILGECGIPGCIIHSLDKFGDIIEHYRSVADLSPDFQEGYSEWENYPGRISIEVYTHTICIIYDDGSVKFIERT